MEKFAKNFLKVLAVMAIFAGIFSVNLLLRTNDIHNAKPLSENVKEQVCEGQTMSLGCLKEEFGISTFYAFLGMPVFVFFTFLIILKKADKTVWMYTPLLMLFYVLLTEMTIKIFNVPVIHVVPMEGDISILSTVFLGWGRTEYVLLILFGTVSCLTAAFFGVLRDYDKKNFNDSAPLIQ